MGLGGRRGRPLAIVPSKIKVLSYVLSSSVMPDDNSEVLFPRIAPIVPESLSRGGLTSPACSYTSAFVLFVKTASQLSRLLSAVWTAWTRRSAGSSLKEAELLSPKFQGSGFCVTFLGELLINTGQYRRSAAPLAREGLYCGSTVLFY